MSLVDWLTLVVAIGALVVSVWSAQATKRQADTAARTAMDARRSAAAAEAQVELMRRAQVDAEAERVRVATPSLRAVVQRHQLQSFLTLVNMGSHVVHLRAVRVGGEPFEFLAMLSKVYEGLPRVEMTIRPDEARAVFRGITKGSGFYGVAHPPMDWAPIEVDFHYGPEATAWVWCGEVRVLESGLIEGRGEEIRRATEGVSE